MVTSLFRFSLFALYVGLAFILPFSVLWGGAGFFVAFVGWSAFLAYLGWNAPVRIAGDLGAREITRSEAPYVFHITQELCRRAQLPVPKLWIFSSKVPNIAAMGFTKRKSHLVLTTEVLQLRRTEQIALVARGIVLIAKSDIFNSTWLTRFLNLVEGIVGISRKTSDYRKESDSLRHFLLQTVLYPASMVPIFLLGKTGDPETLDEYSLRISQQPLGLSETYRKIEYGLQTQQLKIPLSTYHLFLAEPKRMDVLTHVLFKRRSLLDQIEGLNPLKTRG